MLIIVVAVVYFRCWWLGAGAAGWVLVVVGGGRWVLVLVVGCWGCKLLMVVVGWC